LLHSKALSPRNITWARTVHFSHAMATRFRSLFFVAALGVAVVGCAQKRTQPSAQSAKPQATAPVLPALPQDDPAADKEKRPRFGESVVYVDGKPVGVIRATELPAGLKGRVIKLGEGYETTRYGILDYVKALGVDAKKVKGLHLYGGSRVVVVDKAETARIGDRITFSFVQGDRGKPRLHWPPVKLNTNSTIDMVSNVAVYVEKEPPVLTKDGELVMPDGSPIAGKVPYAPEEQGNGTRVYVDGTLVGTVKRKKITNDMILTTPDKASAKNGAEEKKADAAGDRFSLLSYASMLRADAKQAKAVDLVAGDDVIAHLTPESARALTFNVPARNRGQAVVDLPMNDSTQRARVSAVQIYVNSTPPTRPVAKLDEAPDANIQAGGQGGQNNAGADDDL